MTAMRRESRNGRQVIEKSPAPSSMQLDSTADLLAADGQSDLARDYRQRAGKAREQEAIITETFDHAREVAHAAQDAESRFPNDLPTANGPVCDYSADRGQAIASWLIDHGWEPPARFAFVTPLTEPARLVKP